MRREIIVELIFLYLSNLNKYFFYETNKCGCILLLFCRRPRRKSFAVYTFKVVIALRFVMRKDCINICIDSARINSFIVYVIFKAMNYTFHYYQCGM